LLHGFHGEAGGLVRFAIAARAGMHYDEIGAKRDAANEFIVKGLDGAGAQHGLLRGEIDQIICMNDQRAEAEFDAAGTERGGVDFGDPRGAAGPHAGAGRKDLQGVATEFVRGLESVEMAAGDGGMNPDAQRAVHPGWRCGFGLRFGAVLVFRVEFNDVREGLFRHSQ
jgi:hypothetical protein